jgi:hypothetical protein
VAAPQQYYSSICPHYTATKSVVRNKNFGSEHTLAIRKVTLDKILKLKGDEKVAFVAETSHMVERLCNIGIKTQMFVNSY